MRSYFLTMMPQSPLWKKEPINDQQRLIYNSCKGICNQVVTEYYLDGIERQLAARIREINSLFPRRKRYELYLMDYVPILKRRDLEVPGIAIIWASEVIGTLPEQINTPLKLITTFNTFTEWINKATSRLAGYDPRKYTILCCDIDGYICEIGTDFMAARENNRFPVKAYLLTRSSQMNGRR